MPEIGWAPDSNAFFLTASDGGNVGTWLVRVYLIENKAVRMVDIGKQIEKQFRKEYFCIDTEIPNMAGISWLNKSNKLLIVAEVPPHSSCREMGKKKGYVVLVPSGQILQEIPNDKLKSDWGKHILRSFAE